ncbi:hypothetical protein ACKWTF_003935 [Chironomus riparius]
MHHNSDHFKLISSQNVRDLQTSSNCMEKIMRNSFTKANENFLHDYITKRFLFLTFFSSWLFLFTFFNFHFNCTTAQPKLKLMSTDTLIFVQLELHFVEHYSREV